MSARARARQKAKRRERKIQLLKSRRQEAHRNKIAALLMEKSIQCHGIDKERKEAVYTEDILIRRVL